MASLPEHARRSPLGGLPYVPHETPRQWVLPLMTGTRMTANDRPHWATRAEITREWRTMAAWYTRQARIPRLARARIVVEWMPYDRRRRDAGNVAPLAKAAVDGIVDAGVLPDDSSAYLDGPDMRMGPPTDRTAPGRATLRITITEVPA